MTAPTTGCYAATGWLVLRYTWHDVHGDPLGVHDDLLAILRARTD